jgi:undecaprenyl-diphosphatase
MTYLQSIILGIIQGASEFLPISSSGHLVLTPYLLGWEIDPQEAFVFDVLVQVATLTAVIIYYWKDLKEILISFLQGVFRPVRYGRSSTRMGWYLILSTIPAGITAILLKETLENAFSNPRFAAFFLICTSLLLLLGEILGKRSQNISSMSWLDSLIIGLFQVLALFPGISRSGATITGGMIRNLDRGSAARYSFLMAVPVMLAAGLLAGYDLLINPLLLQNLPVYLAGFATAALVGYLAIRWFINYLSRKSLYVFAIYCAVVGTGFLISLS